jgi:cytochrome P450
VAGSDTVSQGCTALFRHIVGDKTIQSRLRAEINAAFDVGDDYDSVKLAKLPFLDACVQEMLRLVPPVAAGPPRYSEKNDQVLGRFIPAGTTVACPTYTLHRDSRNFRDPDEFKPERWLSDSKIEPHVQDAFIPFSYGPGVCIGKPVALHNMKLIIAKALQKFELSFPKDFDAGKFDTSYKEHNLWLHDPLMVNFREL